MFVHHSNEMSGAEMSLELLLKGLNRDKYDILLVLPAKKGPFLDRIKKLKINIRLVPLIRFKRTYNPLTIGKYIFNILFCWIALFRLLRQNKISLVHANSTTAHIFSGVPALLSGIPCIWHVRDASRVPVMERILQLLCSKIICISEAAASPAPFRSAKTTVVPNALNISEWDPHHTGEFHKLYNLPSDHLLVAQIGQLIPWKNHRDFILAAASVLKKNEKVRFLIVGSDQFGEFKRYEQELKSLIGDKDLANFFIFVPYTETVRELLSEIDVLCHPALNEPFGRIIIEAMALKKPVVAINNGGPSEIVTHNKTGFLVEAGDTECMADILSDLLHNKQLREKTGQAARLRVEENYCITKQLVKIEHIYTDLTQK